MTRLTTGLFCLLLCLTLTVLTECGGWAEDWLEDNRIVYLDNEPTDTKSNFTQKDIDKIFNTKIGLDATITGTNNRIERDIDSQTITTSSELAIKWDPERFDKIVFNKIEYAKNICFKLEGDDVERCVETEWLYKWLKMMQP